MTTSNDDMDVHAGRHGSSEPAAVFASGLAVTNAMGNDVAFNLMPEELNFVVYGNMTFQFNDGTSYTCKDFRVG